MLFGVLWLVLRLVLPNVNLKLESCAFSNVCIFKDSNLEKQKYVPVNFQQAL